MAALLGVAIAGQVAWGELKLLREVRAATRPAGLSAGLRTPLSEFARAHVPAGQTIVFVTEGHGIPELFAYYELSYAMTPSNEIWWAADGTVTTVVDWWLDVSGGTARLLRVARAKGSAYLVFAGRAPPPDLPVIGLWKQDPADTVVQIRTWR